MITFIKAEIQNASELALISERLYRETFQSANSIEDMELYINKAFNLDKIKDEILDLKKTTFLVRHNTNLIGYFQLNQNSPDLGTVKNIKITHSIELVRFYLDSNFHGKKVSSLMMEKVLDFAKKNQYTSVWLGVWENNHRAKAFYKKWGFLPIGKKNFQMGNDPQTDLIFSRLTH